jgi:hypothetical protein
VSSSCATCFSEDATPRPDGAYFVFELIWRGGIYGAIDALLLTVLPCLIIYRSLGGRLATWRRRVAYFAASLVLVITITAVYHLGYSQYREDGVGAPEIGNTIISTPMLLNQVTPNIPDRRRATQQQDVRPPGRQPQRDSARRPVGTLSTSSDVIDTPNRNIKPRRRQVGRREISDLRVSDGRRGASARLC